MNLLRAMVNRSTNFVRSLRTVVNRSTNLWRSFWEENGLGIFRLFAGAAGLVIVFALIMGTAYAVGMVVGALVRGFSSVAW